ncbi:hypothetical protein [Allokutzneria oryzae]|uniref:PASTA domain-containing protein n=1 Tax=Allokutzneria oryzae TaxID=1378989 RepID=A0ABV6A571_9PSEU
MSTVSRDLDYDGSWPVPGFVGLTLRQALALASETEIDLRGASGDPEARVVRQAPQGMHPHRPTVVTIWVERPRPHLG